MKKALIVLTNVEKYENNSRLTGLWIGELTQFYDELVKIGYVADFVSPKGGYIPIDPHSMNFMDDVDRIYYKDSEFRNRALGNTLRPDQVKASDYDLIYYTGGHGVMWDFPVSEEIAEIARQIYQNGGLVTAVCHGVVGLIPIKTGDGKPLISGKVVTGFTNEEEKINGTADIVPFLTQDSLVENGARIEIESAFTPVVKKDGRIFTGQNPQSARLLGQTVVEALKDR